MSACAPAPPPSICSLSIWTRALSCHARSLSACVRCSRRRMRTAVGMSSGLTVAGSIDALGAGAGSGAGVAGVGWGAGVAGMGEGVGVAGVAGAFAGVAGVFAGGVAGAFAGGVAGAFAGGVAGAFAGAVVAGSAVEPGAFLSSGAATATAAVSREERTTTLVLARMRFSDQPRAGPASARQRTNRRNSFGIEAVVTLPPRPIKLTLRFGRAGWASLTFSGWGPGVTTIVQARRRFPRRSRPTS